MDGISRRVKQITEMSVQIASAVEEQSAVSEDINRNIISIRSACEVTVTAGQQSHVNSGDVAGLAGGLYACWRRSFGISATEARAADTPRAGK